jgi:flagellar protein FliL
MAEEIADLTELAPDLVPGRSGKKKLFMVIGAVLLLLAAAGGGAFFLMSDSTPAETTPGATSPAPATRARLGPVQYLDLNPSFVINFPHQGRQRFLQTNLTVMSRDVAALQAVQEHMPVIRHNLINLFSAQLILVFEDPSGIERLRTLATEEVKEVLLREIGREGIDEVLFTTFVLQ